MTNESLCMEIQKGKRELLDLLCEQNRGFIVTRAGDLVFRHHTLSLDTEDLIQSGFLGLITAAYRYNPDKGANFLTYAADWIHKYMQDEIRNTAKESIHVDYDGMTDEVVVLPLYDSRDPYLMSPEWFLLKKERNADLHLRMKLNLSPRERAYILYRFGFEDGEAHTTKEAAEHFNLKLLRAERLESSALKHFWARPEKKSLSKIFLNRVS